MRLAQVSGVKANPIQQKRYIAFGVSAQNVAQSAFVSGETTNQAALKKLIALAEERLEAIKMEQTKPFVPKGSSNPHGQLAAKFPS